VKHCGGLRRVSTRGARRIFGNGFQRLLLIALASGATACAHVESVATARSEIEDLDLPPGAGAQILAESCTVCHDLGGLYAYQGYYDERRWRGLVETMISHGADVDASEESTLVDYLVRYFGPGTRTQAASPTSKESQP